MDAMSGQPYSGFGAANIFSGNLFGSAPRQQMVLSLQLRAGQAHDYANMTRPVKAAFAAAPGASFTIFGPAPPRDSATVGLRLWTMLDAGYMPFLRYDGDIARGADSHAINAGVRMNW
jgi:fibronectin-binding autotransporter adhesin